SSRDHRALHSFPTRRSSDLRIRAVNKLSWVGQRRCMPLSRIAGEGGPTAQRWEGESCRRRWVSSGGDFLTRLDRNGLEYLLKGRSEEHTSELQSQSNLVCRL